MLFTFISTLKDIKHNLDSLVNQLCSLRLGTNQHQRLLLLRQRQLIEEDELRLKHYVEYEKFQKAMRQCKWTVNVTEL